MTSLTKNIEGVTRAIEPYEFIVCFSTMGWNNQLADAIVGIFKQIGINKDPREAAVALLIDILFKTRYKFLICDETLDLFLDDEYVYTMLEENGIEPFSIIPPLSVYTAFYVRDSLTILITMILGEWNPTLLTLPFKGCCHAESIRFVPGTGVYVKFKVTEWPLNGDIANRPTGVSFSDLTSLRLQSDI